MKSSPICIDAFRQPAMPFLRRFLYGKS